jgi:hypothetical protein
VSFLLSVPVLTAHREPALHAGPAAEDSDLRGKVFEDLVLFVELPPVENTGAFSFPYVKLPPPSGRRQVKYLPPQIAPDSYVVTPRTPHTDAAASEDKQSSEDGRWLDRPYLDCDMRGEESLWAALTVAPYPINLREVVRGIRFLRAVHDSCIQGKVIVRVLVGEDGKY